MPLSTEGLIEEIARFRSDKLALVALLGSMGETSEIDALARLRSIIQIAGDRVVGLRRLPLAERRRLGLEEKLWHDVWELATEAEPWLADLVERSLAR